MRATLTWVDVRMYRGYTNKHGPLSVARMHDRPAALVAMAIARANGGKANIADFMPFAETSGEIQFD